VVEDDGSGILEYSIGGSLELECGGVAKTLEGKGGGIGTSMIRVGTRFQIHTTTARCSLESCK
jgi:hypothetical protein